MTIRLVCGFALALWVTAVSADDSTREAESLSCHGTAVAFVTSPVEAAKLAAKQKKLVFVLHVSGHFEDPTFT